MCDIGRNVPGGREEKWRNKKYHEKLIEKKPGWVMPKAIAATRAVTGDATEFY